jgi:hypothetical protein
MAAAVAERTVLRRRTEEDNLCPGCGPVPGPRSRYCQTHLADLWRQVWAHRPSDPPKHN